MIKLYLKLRASSVGWSRPVIEMESGEVVTADKRITLAVQRGAKCGSFTMLPTPALLRKMKYAGLNPDPDERILIEIK